MRLKEFWGWLTGYFRVVKELPAKEPSGPPKLSVIRRETREQMSHNGAARTLKEFFSIADRKLEQLLDLRLSSVRDPMAISLIRKHGVTLINTTRDSLKDMELNAMTLGSYGGRLPGFGVVSWNWGDDDGGHYEQWSYFSRVNPKDYPTLAPTRGRVYKVGVIWNRGDKLGQLDTDVAYVTVTSNGKVRPIPYLSPVTEVVRGRNGRVTEYTHKKWIYRHEVGGLNNDGCAGMFCFMMNEFCAQESMWRVSLRKSGFTLRMTLADNNAPYFFKDRVKNNDRVFHIVAGYEKANGKLVSSYPRGVREFECNGYEVNIQMPGKHRKSMMQADFEAQSQFEEGMVDMSDGLKVLESAHWR